MEQENNNSSEALNQPKLHSTGVAIDVTTSDSSSSLEDAKTVEDTQKKYSVAWFEDIKEKVEHLQQEVDNMSGFNDAIDGIRKSLVEAEQKQNSLKKELDNESKRHTKESVEILGIFISLFTFISVSVSIALQFNTVFHAAFILMVFLTGLMCFVYLFHHVLNHKHRPLKKLYYFNRRFSLKIFLLHHWRTGGYCFLIPFVLAILLGLVSIIFGPEKLSSRNTNEPTNVNYIQNIPTSKIRLDENIEQYNTSSTLTLSKSPMKSSVAK